MVAATYDEDVFERPATPRTVDFTAQRNIYYIRDEHGKMHICNSSGIPLDRGITTEQTDYPEPMKNSPGTGMAANRAQLRARARRRLKNGERLTDQAFAVLYKPLEEWDAEELAKGYPRNSAGKWNGRPPKYITREVHERALERFKTILKSDMNHASIEALKTMQMILESQETDNRGKPIVSASAKLDAAKFLLEHVVGKPTQPVQADISVKLQAVLGMAMVNPSETGLSFAHIGTRGAIEGAIDAEWSDDDEEDDDGE